ncbi:VWA domain-containing protein [Thalassococcus sp. BH17M4-6]|uniref:VWA domain-containing protein n=1 Tax=Thalassococcus sp. BH17M4-6 TaxID=3413148 RepID=UPI003BD4FF39
MSLPDLALLRPVWLVLLPALVLLGVVLRRRQAGLGDWNKVVDPAMMRALRALGRVDAQSAARRGLTALVAAGLIALALIGPAVERRDAAAFRNLDGVVFVLDASPSMLESERWPALQTMGRFGIAALGSRPAGLVVFGGDAYVATDMTGDTDQLGLTFSLIDGDTLPNPGSRPERGLELAARMLRDADVLAGDVVLISDGGGLGPAALEQAAAIAAQGARLSVVSAAPGDTVAVLARTGGGQVFDTDQTDDLAAFLRQSGRERLEQQDYPLLFWADYGRYVLLLALIPVLMLFRRRGLA